LGAVVLEPVGEHVAEKSSATSKSTVSRRFVAMTETALAELLAADLSRQDLVALLIDGVHLAESCCLVALGIDIEGNKHPLALVDGSTENATLVCAMLVDPRERGLDVTRPMLVGIDGSKALRKAVLDGKDHLPQRLRSSVGRRMTDAYHARSALEVEAALLDLTKELDRTTRRGGEPARGPGRDARGATERSAHGCTHAALDELHRVDDLGLPRTCRQRQALAGRADGAALVRRRDV
jgi:putative transposase